VALFLQKNGISNVYPVAGGMNRWIELGLPVKQVDTGAHI